MNSMFPSQFAVKAAALLCVFCAQLAQAVEPLLEPNPDLHPQMVVKFQLQALQQNDNPVPNAGIRLAYEFASPGNRESIGGFGNFVDMIHQGYSALLNHSDFELEPIKIAGDHAVQHINLVDSDGTAHNYVWILRRQDEGNYADCWLTDSVVELADDAAPKARPRTLPKGVI